MLLPDRNDEELKMTTNDAIYQFLTTNGNIRFASEITDYFLMLRDEMHKRFWVAFNILMKSKLEESSLVNNWRFLPYDVNKLKKDWGICYLEEIIFSSNTNLTLFIGQESFETGYRLVWGIKWRNGNTTIDDPAMTKLKSIMISHDIKDHDDWAESYGHMKYKLFDPDIIEKLYLNPDDCVNMVINDYLDLFNNTKPLMEKINTVSSGITNQK
jgi:hypothetical protein